MDYNSKYLMLERHPATSGNIYEQPLMYSVKTGNLYKVRCKRSILFYFFLFECLFLASDIGRTALQYTLYWIPASHKSFFGNLLLALVCYSALHSCIIQFIRKCNDSWLEKQQPCQITWDDELKQQLINAQKSNWRWLFLVAGAMTVIVGVVLFRNFTPNIKTMANILDLVLFWEAILWGNNYSSIKNTCKKLTEYLTYIETPD